MHIAGLIIFVVIALVIIFREPFMASFNDMINRARDPIFVNYRGRERDIRGMDYYDHFLTNQVHNDNIPRARIVYK
jgi:hypothetical protein